MEWRAADWNLKHPDWSGRIRVVSIILLIILKSYFVSDLNDDRDWKVFLVFQVSLGDECLLMLESAGYEDVYAECLVLTYPGPDIQGVADSSR